MKPLVIGYDLLRFYSSKDQPVKVEIIIIIIIIIVHSQLPTLNPCHKTECFKS